MNKVAFLDTNTLLHFRPIREINWCEVCESEFVDLIINTTVLSELDKIKVLHNNSTIKKRAQNNLVFFHDIIKGNGNEFISENVRLQFIDVEPNKEIFNNNALSEQIIDDRILATMLEYNLTSPNKMILITNDIGLLMKAKRFDFLALQLPDKYKLEINDEKDKELASLRNEVLTLKNKLPKLQILFNNNKDSIRFRLRKLKIPEDYLQRKLIDIKKQYPHTTIEQQYSTRGIMNLLLKSITTEITPESIDEYNRKLDLFYNDYKTFILEKLLYITKISLTYKLEFILVNNGNALAKNVKIRFHFPDGFELSENTYDLVKPTPPTPPYFDNGLNFSFGLSNFLSSHNSYIPNIDYSKLPKPNVGGFRIKKTNSFDVECNVRELMHTYNDSLDELYISFKNYDEVKSFNFDYYVISENMPRQTEGQLNVIIIK